LEVSNNGLGVEGEKSMAVVVTHVGTNGFIATTCHVDVASENENASSILLEQANIPSRAQPAVQAAVEIQILRRAPYAIIDQSALIRLIEDETRSALVSCDAFVTSRAETLCFSDRDTQAKLEVALANLVQTPGPPQVTPTPVAFACHQNSTTNILHLRRIWREENVTLVCAELAIRGSGFHPSPAEIAGTFNLTATEAEIACHIANGATVAACAIETGRKVSTVRWHIKNMRSKLGCHNQSELVKVLFGVL